MENLPKRVSSAKPPKWSKFLQNSPKGTKDISLDLKTLPSETSSAQSSPMSTRLFTNSSKAHFDSFEKIPSSKTSQLNLKIPEHFDVGFESPRGKTIKQAVVIDQHEISLDPNVPGLIWCSYCKGEKLYTLDHKPSNYTFLASLGIFLAGGVLGCFLVPYLIPSCQSSYKKCSQCQRHLQ